MRIHLHAIVLACILSIANSFVPLANIKSRYVHRARVLEAQRDVNMPALSSTMKEGKIVSWAKNIGDKVRAGDVLLVVESDKADMDVEAFEDGFLAAIHTPAGGIASVGAALATLVDSEADIGKVSKSGAPAPVQSSPAPAAVAPAAAASSSPSSSAGAPQFATISMPALSSTMKEGKIVSWSKKVGDKVNANDVLLVVESDKADMDVESYDEGYLAAVLVGDGQTATVGAALAYIAPSKEEVAAVAAFAKGGGVPAPAASAAPASSTTSKAPAVSAAATPAAQTNAPAIVNKGRVSASGYAKALAAQRGIDLRTVASARPDAFIVAQDLTGAKAGAASAPAPAATSSSSAASHSAATTTTTSSSAHGPKFATPSAQKLANENGLTLSKLSGTGSHGSVTKDDVLRALGKLPALASAAAGAVSTPAAAAAAAAASKAAAAAPANGLRDAVVGMDGMQKAVSKNMEKTLAVPVFRVSREIVTDKFDELYAQLKSKGVTVSALLAKAVAEVLKKHPLLNAAYSPENGGSVKFNKNANIAMAVAIDGGLITPTIVGAQDMDVYSIGRKWKELVDKAKGKKLSPAEYSSGTFTISNLGMFGVQQFDAILPPGQGSILAIAAATPKVVQQKNGHFGVQKVMTVTITCDHRHIYGADAAAFLKDLADLLENNVNSLTMG